MTSEKPALTIIVHARENSARARRLFWSLAVRRPKVSFTVLAYDRSPAQVLRDQVALFAGAFPHTYAKGGRGFGLTLGELVKTDYVLLASPESIPLAGCVDSLFEVATKEKAIVSPSNVRGGPSAELVLDRYGSNLDRKTFMDCPAVEHCPLLAMPIYMWKGDWGVQPILADCYCTIDARPFAEPEESLEEMA